MTPCAGLSEASSIALTCIFLVVWVCVWGIIGESRRWPVKTCFLLYVVTGVPILIGIHSLALALAG